MIKPITFERDGQTWVLMATTLLHTEQATEEDLRAAGFEISPDAVLNPDWAKAADSFQSLSTELRQLTDAWDTLSGQMSASPQLHVIAKGEAYARMVNVLRATLDHHNPCAPPESAWSKLARWCSAQARNRRIGCNQYATGKWKVWAEWNDDTVDVGSGATAELAAIDLCDKLATRHPSSSIPLPAPPETRP